LLLFARNAIPFSGKIGLVAWLLAIALPTCNQLNIARRKYNSHFDLSWQSMPQSMCVRSGIDAYARRLIPKPTDPHENQL
jgi:hypothetical protein